jgi:hypothetical protein
MLTKPTRNNICPECLAAPRVEDLGYCRKCGTRRQRERRNGYDRVAIENAFIEKLMKYVGKKPLYPNYKTPTVGSTAHKRPGRRGPRDRKTVTHGWVMRGKGGTEGYKLWSSRCGRLTREVIYTHTLDMTQAAITCPRCLAMLGKRGK